jgi:hypothetical protein
MLFANDEVVDLHLARAEGIRHRHAEVMAALWLASRPDGRLGSRAMIESGVQADYN